MSLPKKMGAALATLGLLSSCSIQRAARVSDVSADRATECVEVCQKLGMHLTAMVVMMSSAGCVCEPGLAESASAGGASAAAGGSTIAATQAAAAHVAAAAAAQNIMLQQQLQQRQH
jgi:hypothetical protein